MARIIGAERNLLGGQNALNATQLADLQTINRILSVSSEISKDSGGDPLSVGILSAKRFLKAERDVLQEMLASHMKKRKEPPQ